MFDIKNGLKKILNAILFFVGLPHELVHFAAARLVGLRPVLYDYYVEVDIEMGKPASMPKLAFIALAPSMVTAICLFVWVCFFPRGPDIKVLKLFYAGIAFGVSWLVAPIQDYQTAFFAAAIYFMDKKKNDKTDIHS